MATAEADWVRTTLAELEGGTLPGVDQWRSYHETGAAFQEWSDFLDDTGVGRHDD
jgi:hypothetical protein